MTGLIFVVTLVIALVAVYRPVGDYMYRVVTGPTNSRPEKTVYRLVGVDPAAEQSWGVYARSVLAFSAVSILFLYLFLRFQDKLWLSLGMPKVNSHVSWNTAVSFVTNTNWQAYSGESTMGHLVQMAGLAVQNFVSAAVGIAVAVALIRGFAARKNGALGNFWVDLTRITIRVLLPICVLTTVVFIVAGMVQNLSAGTDATTLAGATQHITGGPVASQEAIKELGTNGGGFYNVNSAHPFENPTTWTNWLEIFLLLLIPFSLPRVFGRMVGQNRQGYAIVAVMAILAVASVALTVGFEVHGGGTVPQAAGSAMEGKEVRFGIPNSATFAAATTLTSTGAVDSFHDSYTAFGGMMPIINMMLGEVAPGGVGSGLYGLLILAVITVFVAGLMVGRTPEYLGKKIGAREMKLASLYFLVTPTIVLAGSAAAFATGNNTTALNVGPHGLSEVLYAFTSAGNNNGSAFAGITVNTPWWDTALGLAMLVGRFLPMVLVLALAGSLAQQKPTPDSEGALPTHRPLFVGMVAGVTVILVALTFLPALALGPLAEGIVMTTPTLETPVAGARRVGGGLLDPGQLWRSLPDALTKLDPRTLWHNPVMFIVEFGAVFTTVLSIADPSVLAWTITVWLWLTVIFANLAEAVAEGRGKAQAAALRQSKKDTIARRLAKDGREERVPAPELRQGDVVVVEAGETIPGDGDVIEGIASVDESAITGESAPVIRESGGDRSAVTGGTKVLSDRIVVRITEKPGESFVDRMIALVEGANRQKTPNEIALNILLAALTIIFLLSVVTLQPLAIFSKAYQAAAPDTAAIDAHGVTGIVLVSLIVCLIPTTIGALLSAIGIAGMDRLVQRNVLAMSGRAVEAAGDVDTLLLDKTGTITLGNRQAAEFVPVDGVSSEDLADVAQLSSLADETPEGRSVVILAKNDYGLREREPGLIAGATFAPFSAQTRMSGVDLGDRHVRKGAAAAVMKWVRENGGHPAEQVGEIVDMISATGGTPLVVAEHVTGQPARALGVIHLKDVVKSGMRERFDEMRRMGIRTVMITGDNPRTAKAIADEAGVDDFLAEATPEDKLALIRKEQEGGRLVAMTGDGTNDAPALAQADVGVAMNTGTSAAKEAGNMVDLDSDPTKLIEIVEIGKQLLITRGALTTFSITNDIAKYFAIIPAMFAAVYPGLDKLNIMRLDSPGSAILSAVIFNALIIVALIPLALRGVRYRPASASALLRRNLWIYGLGGVIAPFLGIKLIDLFVHLIPGI